MKPAQTQNIHLQNTRERLVRRFLSMRHDTAAICARLEIEDYVTQPTAEVSPPKWHLGHTTWFFEELLLVAFMPDYRRYHDGYRVLFNSYYKSAGSHWLQGERGYLSRPTVAEILAYRVHVDCRIAELLEKNTGDDELGSLIDIGIQHEQQHQELLLMDIKGILGANPLCPEYISRCLPKSPGVTEKWHAFGENVYDVGYNGHDFSYDNEKPAHKTYIYPFEISQNSVTNGEYLAFMRDDGYKRPEFWLSLGWDWVEKNNSQCPLYWLLQENEWYEFTLHGMRSLDSNAPVTHISYFEADAYARWENCRLATEQEHEIFLNQVAEEEFENSANIFHPVRADMRVGQVWCWTRSHYSPYPGYQPYHGALEEYNGKLRWVRGDWGFRTGAQLTDQRSIGDDLLPGGKYDTQSFGARFSASINNFIMTGAVSANGDGAAIRSPFGGDPGFTSLMLSDFNLANQKTYRLGLSYTATAFGYPGLSGFVNYAHSYDAEIAATGESLPDDEEFDITIDYRPKSGITHGAWLRARYGVLNPGTDRKRYNVRITLNWPFQFL